MSLTSMIGSCRLLCYKTLVEVEWWLSLARDRKYIIGLLSLGKYKNGGNENGDRGRDMVWVLAGVRGCVTVDTGHGLVTLLSLSVSVKNRSLHKPLRQVTDLLSWAHTWVWALGRLVALLSWVLALSGPTVRVIFLVEEVLAPHWVRDSGAGAWSPSLDGDLDTRDRRVMGWSCLCPGYKRGVCFRGTQLGALIHESPGDPVRLVYGLTS